MKKFLRTLPVLAMLLVGCSTTKTTTSVVTKPASATVEKMLYNASGVTIAYMSDRKYMEKIYGSLVTFFSPQDTGDLFRENLGISIEKLPADITVDQYYATTKTQLSKLIKDFKEISNENIVVSSLIAKKIVYVGTQQTYKLKWEQVFLIKDKKVYIFTYTASADTYDKFASQIDTMIKSVTLQ